MEAAAARPLFKAKIKLGPSKQRHDAQAWVSVSRQSEIVFGPNTEGQKVTIFDSSAVAQPFLNGKDLDSLRKLQMANATAGRT